MPDNPVWVLALPAVALLLFVMRILVLIRGRPFSLSLKGFGVELTVHTLGESINPKGTEIDP